MSSLVDLSGDWKTEYELWVPGSTVTIPVIILADDIGDPVSIFFKYKSPGMNYYITAARDFDGTHDVYPSILRRRTSPVSVEAPQPLKKPRRRGFSRGVDGGRG